MFQKTPLKRVLSSPCLVSARIGVFGVVFVLAATLVGGLIFATPKAEAATSSTLNFQARLESNTGAIVPDGTYNIEFKLYNAATVTGTPDQGTCTYNGGVGDTNCLWVETRTGGNQVRVANGYLTVSLGAVNPFPNTINWDQQLWITMRVGGTAVTPSWDGEMNPRLQLTAVPYAFKAGQVAQFNAGTGYTSTLGLLQPTGGNQMFQLPDMGAAGTYTVCVQGGTACGSGGGGSGGSYVALQSTLPGVPDTGNFNISGTGRAGALQAASLDVSASGTLSIGTSSLNTAITIGNAANTATITVAASTTLNLGNNANNKTVNIGATGSTANTTAVNIGTSSGAAQTVNIGSTFGASTTTISAGSGNINLQANSSSVASTMARLMQGGTADAAIEFNNSGIGKSFYIGQDTSTNGNFVINSSTSASNGALGNITHVQTVRGVYSGSTSVTSVSRTFASNNTAGNLIVVAFTFDTTTTTSYTCSDSRGNTYQTAVVRNDLTYAQQVGICYAMNIAGGANTVTVTVPVARPYFDVSASEYAGAATTNALDVTANNLGTGTTATDNVTTSNAITTQGHDLVFGAVRATTNATTLYSAGTGFNQRDNGTSYQGTQMEDKIQTVAGSAEATFTSSLSSNYEAVMASFKAAFVSGTITDTFSLPLFSLSQTGALLLASHTDATNAFQVQNATGSTVLTADTLSGSALLGQASALNGTLKFASASNTNIISLSVGATSASYTLVLPTAAPTAGGQCLATATGSTTNLTFTSCGSGGGSHVKAVTMVPEYAGAIFSPSGSNNTGYMSSGYDHTSGIPGVHHNYYDWTTDQTTAQNYDIVVQYQVPSDFSSFVSGSWKLWAYTNSLTGAGITWTVRGANDTSCVSQSALPGSAATWTQISLSNPSGCTISAGDVLTIDIQPSATSSTGQVRIGEFTYQYNTAY